MKKFSLILSALVLFAGVSFANPVVKQDKKSDTKTEKKDTKKGDKKGGKKGDTKKGTDTKAAK